VKQDESMSLMEDIMIDDSLPSHSRPMSNEAAFNNDQVFDLPAEDDSENSLYDGDLWETSEIQQICMTPPSSAPVRQEISRPNMSSHLTEEPRRYIVPSELQRSFVPLDFQEIVNTLRRHVNPSRAVSIADHLHSYFRSKDIHITGLCARPVELFGEDQDPISEVEWQEGDDSDVLALFRVPNDAGPCSYLMHVNMRRKLPHQPGNHAHLDWSVSNTAHFKDLFKAAKHKLGLLKWSTEDLTKLCAENLKTHGAERYALSFFDLLIYFKVLEE
jgi:hypothetical protein